MRKSSGTRRPVASIALGLAAAITAFCVAGALWTQYTRTMLILASTGFVTIGLLACLVNPSRYGYLVLAALIFCWLGDFLGPRDFIAGLVMFLIAHPGFVAAFWSLGIDAKKCLYAFIVFLPLSGSISYWLYPFIPKDVQIAVFSYVVIITAMVVFAVGARASSGRFLILLGAVLFYASDIFVARWRFVSPGAINAFLCYPIYYASCILFAFSISLIPKRAGGDL